MYVKNRVEVAIWNFLCISQPLFALNLFKLLFPCMVQEVVVVAGPGCVMHGGPQLPDYEPEPPSPADQLSHVNALLASQAALARYVTCSLAHPIPSLCSPHSLFVLTL